EPPLRWHFVGQLQVNKAKSVVRYADVVHSVDRPRLIGALGSRARAAGRVITCLIQVDLDPDPDPERGGARAAEVPALAAEVAATSGLLLGGVMAIAPLGAPPRTAFRGLAEVAGLVRAAYPAATMISAGMTGDLDEAIAEGATHVRVGTALLGSRRAFVRECPTRGTRREPGLDRCGMTEDLQWTARGARVRATPGAVGTSHD